MIRTVIINLHSPWGSNRQNICSSVDERLGKIAAEGWVLVAANIMPSSCGTKRVLMAIFRRGKSPSSVLEATR